MIKILWFPSPLKVMEVDCVSSLLWGNLRLSCLWIFQVTMMYYSSRHLICLIDSSRVEVLQRIEEEFICVIHLMKLGFWPIVKFEVWISQFLEVSPSYYHLSYHGSKNYSTHSENLRFWSLIGYLLAQGAKLGFWV